MIINVTAEHIARGKRNDGFRCPVALAFAEGVGHVFVASDCVARGAFGGILCDLPSEVAAFIDAFDEGVAVSPFAFEVELASPPNGEQLGLDL